MSEFVHSEILFSSDNGTPLEYNIQYVKDKAFIKSLIEHGGGLCTLRDDAIHIVSPGTTVLIFKPGINLISTSYIHDCVKLNYLVDINEYRFVINEMETSDISDKSQSLTEYPEKQKCEDTNVNTVVDVIDHNKNPSPNPITCQSSNHDFDFQGSENPDNEDNNPITSMQLVDVCLKAQTSAIRQERKKAHSNTDNSENLKTSANYEEIREILRVSQNNQDLNANNQEAVLNHLNGSVDAEVVSSSQPDDGDVLNLLDNMVLKKEEENPVEKEDESQNDTVSSSADVQVSPKAPSNNSAEIFNGSVSVLDSADQISERQQYINDLEKEIQQILLKPSPKSIQDKISLVKYICTVKKMAPAIVLQTLQNF